jgi:hypothetical protein
MKGTFRVTPCSTVRIEWRCECTGNMVYKCSYRALLPKPHTHECDRCLRQDWSEHVYPRIEHREDSTEVWFEKVPP